MSSAEKLFCNFELEMFGENSYYSFEDDDVRFKIKLMTKLVS